MKIKSIFIMSLVMALSFVGCTSDMDESVNSQEKQLSDFKTRYYALAEEYGVENNIINDDNIFRSKMEWTDCEIEDEIKFIASFKGQYKCIKKGNLYRLVKINRTRSFDDEHETWEGSISDSYFDFEVGFDYYYSQFGGLDYVKLTTFNYSPSSSKTYSLSDFTVSQVTYNFVGDKSFTYSAKIFKSKVGDWLLMVTCSEDELSITIQ